MKRLTFTLITIMAAVAIEPSTQANEQSVCNRQLIKTDMIPLFTATGKSWTVISTPQLQNLSKTLNNRMLLDFVPKGQSLTNWKEMIQYRVFPKDIYYNLSHGEVHDVKSLVSRSTQTLAKTCPDSNWKTVSSSPTTITYQYQVRSCPIWGTQYKIEKLTSAGKYYVSISYVYKDQATQKRMSQYASLLQKFNL